MAADVAVKRSKAMNEPIIIRPEALDDGTPLEHRTVAGAGIIMSIVIVFVGIVLGMCLASIFGVPI